MTEIARFSIAWTLVGGLCSGIVPQVCLFCSQEFFFFFFFFIETLAVECSAPCSLGSAFSEFTWGANYKSVFQNVTFSKNGSLAFYSATKFNLFSFSHTTKAALITRTKCCITVETSSFTIKNTRVIAFAAYSSMYIHIYKHCNQSLWRVLSGLWDEMSRTSFQR